MTEPLRSHRAHTRLAIASAVGLVMAFVGSLFFDGEIVMIAGWNAAALYLLVSDAVFMVRADAISTRHRAGSEDPGRRLLFLVVVVASSFAIFANAVVLRRAANLPALERGVLIGLCVCAVLVAWLLTHTVFALRYAHLYYGRGDEGGLAFPGNGEPDDLDFAYYSFTVGMCFQVSDVAVTSREIRRTTLFHALLSFAFNSIVLALAFNLVFSLLG